MEHLLESLLQAILSLVRFANLKVKDGTMKRERLIYPRDQLARKLFSLESSNIENEVDKEAAIAVRGSSKLLSRPIDPEHLQLSNV